ncbi:MAG: hypothetical protein E7055_05065 [Lentisphaerae bacterium]|nr:hypothetical protein [Lentisphaerota bacterium]
MNMENVKQVLKQALLITRKTVIFIVCKIDYCYNLLPLDKINGFLSQKGIKINVKSKVFKYSLSTVILLLCVCIFRSGRNVDVGDKTHFSTPSSNVSMPKSITMVDHNRTSTVSETRRPASESRVAARKTTVIPSKQSVTTQKQSVTTQKQSVTTQKQSVTTQKQSVTTRKQSVMPSKKQESIEKAAKRISVSDAIAKGRIDIIAYLLKNNKININQRLSAAGADVMRGMRPESYLKAEESANDDTLLMRAIRAKSHKLVEFLLSKGADVNLSNCYNETALHIAVKMNDVKVCKMILKDNTTINQRNTLDETPLLIAVKNGFKPITELLLKHNAKVPKKAGGKLLVEFIKKNDIESAKVLCESGADVSYEVDQSNYGIESEIPIEAPITLAVKNNNPDLVKYLLEKGASTIGKGKNLSGYCDFVHIYVASHNRPDILPLLSYNPATTERMLCYAAYYGYIDVMKFLLKQKHNINQFVFFDNGRGTTKISSLFFLVQRCSPLAMAIAGRQYEAAKLLLDNGADPEFIKVETYEENARVKIFDPIVAGGISDHTDWLERRFDWVMKWRAGYCEPKFYELLAEYGRQPKGMDLFFAAVVENSSLMDRLLQQKVKPPEDVKEWGNYIVAVRPPTALKILALLFDKSILPINQKKNPFEHTLLMNAITCKCEYFSHTPNAQIERKDIVSFLLKHGADPNLYTGDPNNGQSALYYAISKKQDDIIKILLANNAKMPYRDADRLLGRAHGSLPEYKYFFSKGLKISIDPKRFFGDQSIRFAIVNEPYVISKLVIENCEDLNIVPEGEKITLLDYIEPRVKNKQIIKLMRNKGAKKYSELKQNP